MPAPPLGPPASLPFELGGVIGRGGMGEVRSAFDPHLDRDVAVKLVSPGDSQAAQRLAREATLTARLEHPGIVPVYAAGTAPDGRAWYAMRLLPGRSLEAAIRAAPTSTERITLVRHVLYAAEAVAYAHGQGILHRDLKPANILTGPFGETVVGDWGSACTFEEAAAAPGPAGTAGYMSPEHLSGGSLNATADVYALGATLAEVVTGQAPDLDTPLLLSRAARAAPELVAIAERALRPEATERYPTAQAFVDDLLAWFEGRRVSAHEYSPGEVMARFIARWRVPLAVGAVGLVGVLGAVSYGWWQTDIARRAAQTSEQASLRARADEVHAYAAALRTQAANAAVTGFDSEAELLAAHALKRLENADTRGVLAAVSGRPRWALVADHAVPRCTRRSLSTDGTALLCFNEKGANRVDVATGAVEIAAGTWNRGSFAGSPTETVLVDESLGVFGWTSGGAPVALASGSARWSVFPPSLLPGVTMVQTNNAALRVDVRRGTVQESRICGVSSSTQRATLDAEGRELTVCIDLRVIRKELDGSITLLHRFTTEEGVPSYVAASPDGRVVAGTLQGFTVVLDAEGHLLNHRRLGQDAVFGVSLLADRAAVGLSGGDVAIWDLAADTVVTRFRGHDPLSAWLPDGSLRLSGERVEDRRVPMNTHPHRSSTDSGVTALAWSPDSALLASGTGSGAVVVMEAATGNVRHTFRNEPAVAKDIAFSPKGDQVAVASAKAVQMIYALSDGAGQRLGEDEAWRRVAWMAKAGVLGVPYRAVTRLFGSRFDVPPTTISSPAGFGDIETDALGQHAVGLDGANAIYFADDGPTPLWKRIPGPAGAAAVACSADTIALITRDELFVVDREGAPRWQVAVPGTAVDVAISPDSRWAAVGTLEGSVHVWEVGHDNPRARLLGHRARAAAVAFSPDGKWLATGGWDDEVRQWSVSAFDADGATVAEDSERALGSSLDEVMRAMFDQP